MDYESVRVETGSVRRPGGDNKLRDQYRPGLIGLGEQEPGFSSVTGPRRSMPPDYPDRQRE